MPVDYSQYIPDWIKEFQRCEQWIEDALEYSHGMFTIQDVFEDVMHGNAQFWPGEKSAIITQIVDYPRKKAIHVFLAGGDMEEIQSMEPGVIEWAKSQGCEVITLTGRPGWTRTFLTKIGYKNTQVQILKEI
jgi:hypothetical protein